MRLRSIRDFIHHKKISDYCASIVKLKGNLKQIT